MEMVRTSLLNPSDLADQPDFDIGAVHVSPSRRIVRGPGGQAAVEPRVMQVLIVLVEAGGAVVSREVLLDRCWGGVFVGDDSLNRAIASIRRLAGSVGGGAFAIETVPRTGYRLVASDTGTEDEGHKGPSETGTLRGRFSRRAALTGGLALAAGGTTYLALRPRAANAADPIIAQSEVAMRANTPEGCRRAVGLLEQAIKISPNYARAWGALALPRARADEHAIDRTMWPATKVDEAAHRALALDPGNADAQAALAIAVPYYGDWLAGEERFNAVLRRHPDHLATRDSHSFFLGSVGRMRESGRERLGLADQSTFDAGLIYRQVYGLWFQGRIDDADRTASRGMDMWPRHPGIWFARLWMLASTGRIDRALAQIADEAARPPLPPAMVDTLRLCMQAAQSGRADLKRAAADRAMKEAAHNVASVVNATMLLNLMGELDHAFELAEAYYLERGPVLVAMEWRPGRPVVPDQRRRKTNMIFTPTAAPMQRDPRFLPMMKRMGLWDYWTRRKVRPDFMQAATA